MAAKHASERNRAQTAQASAAPVEPFHEEDHVHEPFLFGWDTNAKGEAVEIWRCLSDFQVSERVANPNHDPEHEHHVPELAGQGPELVSGRTIYPGDIDHPYGQPCGVIIEVVHDPAVWSNERAAKAGSQQALYHLNAPDQLKPAGKKRKLDRA